MDIKGIISSEDIIERSGGATDEQRRGAQAMIDRMASKYKGFKIKLEDVLVMHVAQGLSFEHIERTLSEMIKEDEEMT